MIHSWRHLSFPLFTSISWTWSFFINIWNWFVCMYIPYAVLWVWLSDTQVFMAPGPVTASVSMSEWFSYTWVCGRAWFVDDVTRVSMVAVQLGLWLKPGFEWGLSFCGYNRDWFVSEITTEISVVTVRPDEKRDGLVHECFIPSYFGVMAS
jgi:hypothetical protein